MVDPRKLSEFASFFKNADPDIYERFIRLLDQYTAELTVAVTEAEASSILIAQGRAQQARKFLQLFTEIREPNKPSP